MRRQSEKWPYEDIVNLPHHVSDTHVPMPMIKRAAQFAPFAALTGYEAAVSETARLTDDMIELTDTAMDELDRRMREGMDGRMTITYFVPDERKAGGETVTVTEKVRRIDPVNRKIILDRKKGLAGSYEEISLDRIIRIGQEDRTE